MTSSLVVRVKARRLFSFFSSFHLNKYLPVSLVVWISVIHNSTVNAPSISPEYPSSRTYIPEDENLHRLADLIDWLFVSHYLLKYL